MTNPTKSDNSKRSPIAYNKLSKVNDKKKKIPSS